MATIKRFEEVKAWQKARYLVSASYQESAAGAFQKDFPLRDQIRRAAISSMSNIAEGFARKTRRDFAHFLDVARGSAAEVQSLLYVALDAGHISSERFHALYGAADEAISLIGGLTSYLRETRGRTNEPPTPNSERRTG